jgi:hypothetical protein
LAGNAGGHFVLPAGMRDFDCLGEVETGMSYEMSDKIILQGELMKYRRSLCEKVAKYGGICKKCPAHQAGKCAISIVIKSLNE